jgi:hypothetical protein
MTAPRTPSRLTQAAEVYADQELAQKSGHVELDRYDLEAAFVAGANWEYNNQMEKGWAGDERERNRKDGNEGLLD